MDTKTALAQEWRTLQDNHERYEAGSLWTKLAAVLLTVAGVAIGLEWWLLGLLVLALWLQEGIYKTFQARLGARLLRLEGLLALDNPPPGSAFQLHTEWQSQRRGTAGLLREHVASACRPTVAFPHALLLLILVLLALG